jgi:PilZ domain
MAVARNCVSWFANVARRCQPCILCIAGTIDESRRMNDSRERASERVRVDAFVKVHGADGQELVFRTRDLSDQGLFLYTKVARAYPFRVGSTLALELYDFDQQVSCKVVVVRVVEPGSPENARFPTGFGVRILECDDASRLALSTMIARVKAGEVY